MRGDLEVPAYVYPARWETPSSSKAQRWRGVGVVMTVKAGRLLPACWMRLAAMVARSSSRAAKLCTGPPPVVAFVTVLGSAAGERWARVTSWAGRLLGPRRDAHVYAPPSNDRHQASPPAPPRCGASGGRNVWR